MIAEERKKFGVAMKLQAQQAALGRQQALPTEERFEPSGVVAQFELEPSWQLAQQ